MKLMVCRIGELYVVDWCVTLVSCMYWTGVLHVLDWCVACTGLVCYWFVVHEASSACIFHVSIPHY